MSDASSKTKAAHKEVAKPKAWGIFAILLITGVTFVLAQVFAGIIIAIGVSVPGWTNAEINAWLESTIGQFIFVLLFEAFTLGLIWFAVRLRRMGWRAIGLARPPNLGDLGYVLLATVVYFGLLVVANNIAIELFNINSDQKQDTGFDTVLGGSQLLMVFISLVVLPPIVEEVLFRGFLFGGLRAKMKLVWAMLITSVLFGALHLFGGVEGEGLLWIAGIDTFILSLVLCYVREKTGALWACIGIHALKNGIAFVYLFVIQ